MTATKEQATGLPPARQERKAQVLTRHSASSVRSIADAVVIKDGEPFFICPPDGQIPTSGDHGYGLYHHDTRFLNGYELAIAGVRAHALAATSILGSRGVLELTTPEIDLGHGRTIAKERLAIRWTRQLDGDRARLTDQIELRNFDAEGARLPLRFRFGSDFEDIFEVRGLLEEQLGALHKPRWDGDTLVFRYDGKDGVIRRLRVSTDPKPKHGDDPMFEIEVEVPGRGSSQVEVRLEIGEELEDGATPIERRTEREPGSRPPSRQLDGRSSATPTAASDDWPARVTSDSLTLNGLVARSLDDLVTLRGELDGHRYYAAGVPWFSTLFGRDSLIAAYQTLAFDAGIAAETLRLLAGRQGRRDDDYRDEQPGKILHELRIGELARLHEIPHTPYYGSIDSTPLFLVVLARHAAWTGSLDLFHELRDNVDAALRWLDGPADPDGRGWIAYDSAVDHGLVNQGWKDSGDAIVRRDGSPARPPIALAEVQGYAYAAKRELAALFERDGDAARAERLRREARDLQRRFEDHFWSDELGCYVLALDRDGPCEVVTSNAGQVLWSGIASAERAQRVASRLLEEDVFAGWGIRTLSHDAAAFNPIGYHLGTIWPHDNGLIADGFRRYDLVEPMGKVAGALMEASTDFPQQRLPECFAGYDRRDFGIPVRYPVACHPQAWAAGAVPHLLTSMLGLAADGFERRLTVDRPWLPGFMRHLELRGLRVGSASVDLAFDREDQRHGLARARVIGLDGDLDVRLTDQVSRP
ncbi:MAG TPA: glycogen debranching N-terminal domain-containing protein [Candidatus Limnocylindrales bacterium]|nr:glycogen debranching N-terminal domain-containing protein [Candidatus Limnocylindrales bacterium]